MQYFKFAHFIKLFFPNLNFSELLLKMIFCELILGVLFSLYTISIILLFLLSMEKLDIF